MFYHDKRLQFPVRVDNPDPVFAKMLQQALGRIDGEVRVVAGPTGRVWTARASSAF